MEIAIFIANLIIIYLLFSLRSQSGKNSTNHINGSVVMDTSALIDARIVDVAKAGFLQKTIIVPEAVLAELQLLADGRDSHKRERARVGLDSVNELKQVVGLDVIIQKFKSKTTTKTDDIVLQIALRKKADVCTTDFNLNKVAVSNGLKVLNVNELSQNLRPKMLPGEEIEVKIVQKGETTGQGIGYSDDGTMIVVQGTTSKMRNQVIKATVERMIQTKAGKMIFAKKTN